MNKSTNNFYFAIDVGGTFLKYASITPDGRIISQGQTKTPHIAREAFTRALAVLVPAGTSGIGICFPGFIDSKNGICKSCGTLEWLEAEYPLARDLSALTGCPVTVENDARCACMAEAGNGALQGVRNGAVMVLGTAVGCGLILDGRPYQGSLGKAGEIGYNRSRKRNYWGYACSVPALCRDAAEAYRLPEISGEALLQKYAEGEETAVDLLNEYLTALSEGIFSMQNLLDLERIAIGGGISRNSVFIHALQGKLHEIYTAIPYQLHEPDLLACRYGNDANLIGAFYYHLLHFHL